MTAVVPDVNVQGQIVSLVHWYNQTEWQSWWKNLDIELFTFRSLGWELELPDREIWNRCQDSGYVLITENRNYDGADSLEATIRNSVQQDSLPVITISDKVAFQSDRAYAERFALDLLEVLNDIKELNLYLGTGRLYLPKTPSS